MQHQPGDQLVLLDSSWHADFFPFAEQLKREGVGIVSVIYDLIPLTHPQFYDTRLVQVFNEWFDWITRTADGYVAISATVRDQVREEMQRRLGPAKANERWFDYFHLGSELDLSEATAAVEPRLARLFKTPEPVFLMVSTIEPRKNHDYLLDAFERAWAAGSKARLCIAGRIGWKCDALLARVRNHPQLNQRLFMFNDLSDTSLEHAYCHASCAGVSVLCRRLRPATGGSHAARVAGHGQRYSGLSRNRRRVHGVLRSGRATKPGRSGRAVSSAAVSSRPPATSQTGAGSAGVKPVRNWPNESCAILYKRRSCQRGNMRIALNARILQAPRTGIGHYVAELANALAQ